jgi:hypothetical protein
MHRKHDTVANVMSTTPLNISLRTTLVVHNLVAWHDLEATIANITLNDQNDSFRWIQTKNDSLQNNICIKILLVMLQLYMT